MSVKYLILHEYCQYNIYSTTVYYGTFPHIHKITQNRLKFESNVFYLFYLTVIANCYLNDATTGGN